jgi:hypothetical protein
LQEQRKDAVTTFDSKDEQRVGRYSYAVWQAVQMITLNNARLATREICTKKKVPFNAKLRSETCRGIKVLYVKCG